MLTDLTIEDFEQPPAALAHNHEPVDGDSVADFLLAKFLLHVEERNLDEVG